MKNLTKRQRNRIYKKGKKILINSYNPDSINTHDGLCECLRKSIYYYKIVPEDSIYYDQVREMLPEFYKRKPKLLRLGDMETYWYEFDNRGFALRKRLLDKCIEETK